VNAESPIDPAQLTRFGTSVCAALGVPAADAQLVADSLVQADLWGHASHGVMRLPWYARRLQSGAMHAVTQPRTVVDAGAVAVIDGADGIGQVLAERATREAMRRARLHGIAAVAVRNSNHFGTAMYYSLMGPPQGCIVMVTTNASPAMAPWGGREKRVGTNPWSLAAPAGRHAPMVLDIANTAVARGKVYLARQKGQAIPAGWALTADGEPTTDAAAAVAGLIAPMAGHKGYAIAVMMDMLSGVLTGSAFGTAVHGPYQSEQRSGCGHLVIALNIAAFIAPGEFDTRMEQLVDQLKSTPLAANSGEVLYPGELEDRYQRQQLREGLRLPVKTLAELRALGAELRVPDALD
jgi:LDH2 family malate/lactate/ureidoglycolate dehydrogenase